MKKVLALILTSVMLFAMCACGETKTPTDKPAAVDETAATECTKLKVAVMPYAISLPVYYAIENDMAKDYGLELEMVMFASGATMNEAMASDQFDVALIGGAGIYGIASYDGVYISDQVYYEKVDDGELTAGDGIYALADHPAASVKGYNPEYPNICGDPETVKGSTILYTSGTTAHQLVIMWLNDLGIDLSEVNMLNMDFAQSYNALITGQADFACLTSPYTTDAQDSGYACIADGKSLHQSSVESMMAPHSFYEKNPEALARFINLIYECNKQLDAGGVELKTEWMEKWYDYNGTSYEHENVLAEMTNGFYATWDNYEKYEFGSYARFLAEFYLINELLTPEAVENVNNNLVTDVMELAKSMN